MDEKKLLDEFSKYLYEEKFEESLKLIEPFKNETFNNDYLCYKIAQAIPFVDNPNFTYDDAEKFYFRAIEINPDNSEYLFQLGMFYELFKPDVYKALEYYEKTLKLDPEHKDANEGRNDCLKEIEDLKDNKD